MRLIRCIYGLRVQKPQGQSISSPKKTKKATTRKKTSVPPAPSLRRSGKKTMVQAGPRQCFWVHNGPILRDLRELEEAFRDTISDAQFKYHLIGGSDFARWVDEVLGDAACAKALAKAKTRKGAATIVVRYLKTYK